MDRIYVKNDIVIVRCESAEYFGKDNLINDSTNCIAKSFDKYENNDHRLGLLKAEMNLQQKGGSAFVLFQKSEIFLAPYCFGIYTKNDKKNAYNLDCFFENDDCTNIGYVENIGRERFGKLSDFDEYAMIFLEQSLLSLGCGELYVKINHNEHGNHALFNAFAKKPYVKVFDAKGHSDAFDTDTQYVFGVNQKYLSMQEKEKQEKQMEYFPSQN